MRVSSNRKKTSGATRQQPNVHRKLKLQWRQWLGRAAVSSVFLVVVFACVVFGRWVYQLPITDVTVAGSVNNVDAQELTSLVAPYTSLGFCCVDLAEIKRQIESHQWIAEVSVRRAWPGTLYVEVVEHEAVAKWGEDGLLARTGEIFFPEVMPDTPHLPTFIGNQNYLDRYVKLFNQLQLMMNSYEMVVTELFRSEKGSWTAQLEDGVKIQFGENQIKQKLQRLKHILDATVAERIEEVAMIDLRYGNGVAVAWQETKDVLQLANVNIKNQKPELTVVRAGTLVH